ncbi:Lon protease family protein [Gilliamella sp. B2840]|nr:MULTISPECIES: Lon protease family protein [unclassified Gilliamella]MCX8657059.1 Lon protease family protein [Gilliamella sp. B2894]MCX8665782.1 Lon protease family protein [Gilliamella sp. B2887]MCX8693784.1 Lon protease family protein [Gilliamella sp. B2881]MCX8697027.1 Lon protease family protein [Gilliamella sp. B2828]MCX8698133.1 Lon protease family protein [Gilliamella sp. B3000]
MAITQLKSQQIQPDLAKIYALSTQGDTTRSVSDRTGHLLKWQPRIASALSLLCPHKRANYSPRFMLLKAPESELLFSLLAKAVKSDLSTSELGYSYFFNENKITLSKAKSRQDNFAVQDSCLAVSAVDFEKLFGCVRQPENGQIKLQAGLVHQVNGGILILGLRSLLNQPELWTKLKQMVIKQEFEWFSSDESHPLPLSIPSMPLDLRVILVGDRLSLAELQDFEPEFYATSIYTEYENELPIKSSQDINQWIDYLRFIADSHQLLNIDNSALGKLYKEATRYTGDQYYLPLSVDWVHSVLVNATHYAQDDTINEFAITQAIEQKFWHEAYLQERLHDEIFTNQIMINTKDHVVGQINGLSVIEYPGYPKAIGEPARLSCLIHLGDGELIDIERKTDLAGNIHCKGMMIMQAFIMSEFAINHQIPFSTSLVFEQSYNEIDGDSASLAGLCAIISALSGQAIDQQLAVTGSVDQFGHVQSIGGVNEKIEGFFAVCRHQGLTGRQGVIIPATNQRHLSLNDEVIEAIEQKQFSIWTVEHIADALYLLTGIPYKDNSSINLYKLIHARMQSVLIQEKKHDSWLKKLQKYCKKQ